MTDALTQVQSKLLATVIEVLLDRQAAPTVRELCALTGIASTNGVSDHLRSLIRKGYLERVGPASGRGAALARNLRVLRWPDGAGFVLTAQRAA